MKIRILRTHNIKMSPSKRKMSQKKVTHLMTISNYHFSYFSSLILNF